MIGKAMAFIGGAMAGGALAVLIMCCVMIGKERE